jgi:hypothetical protein
VWRFSLYLRIKCKLDETCNRILIFLDEFNFVPFLFRYKAQTKIYQHSRISWGHVHPALSTNIGLIYSKSFTTWCTPEDNMQCDKLWTTESSINLPWRSMRVNTPPPKRYEDAIRWSKPFFLCFFFRKINQQSVLHCPTDRISLPQCNSP